MNEIATISIFAMPDGNPAVKISASDSFLNMTALERIMSLIAAAQLCSAAISAVCEDSGEDYDVSELFENLTITPSERAMN